MGEEKLLTVRDVSLILAVSEKEVLDFAESGVLPAYKVGGVYLRFKRDQVEEYRKSHKTGIHSRVDLPKYSFQDRLSDFFYFNDFYILSGILVLVILFIIFRG